MAEHIRYWEAIKPTSQTRLADDVVDAILRDVFQGEKDHLREHMRGVAHKAVRGHEWPYFEECVEKAVADRLASLSPTSCEAGFPAQSCQGCDAGDCAMLPAHATDGEEASDA